MKVCSVCRRCYDDTVLACSEENHESLIETRDLDCEIIPNYRLESLHELTPDGEIYRAVNTILKKEYLIRIVSPESFDASGQKQFLSEAQALATIIHPNVVRVFESGTLADDSLYAVTEFLTAQTLRECLENVGAPSEVTALTITRQAAEGLEALHAQGVLHRGVRPENIILTADAENRFLIKLQNIDFGAIRQKQVIANPEQNIGDLRYFSPEQCAAEDADAQTDVYSLGIVLYEALAGRVPFDSPYADALIKKQIGETPPEIKIHSFDIRMLLTHTLTDALQKQTRTRLKSANAFARRIRHIEQLATHSSTPPPVVAYPATMNKAAVVFTPPAKIETVEPATLPQPETIVEIPVQNIETFAAIETPAAAEALPPLEEASVIEFSPIIEESETPVPVEAEIAVENPVIMENPAAVEIPAAFEAAEPVVEEIPFDAVPAVVEYSFEAEPSVEEIPVIEAPAVIEENPVELQTALESVPVAEPEPIIEEIPARMETVIEIAPPVELPETVIEETAAAEDPLIGDLPPLEAQASFEEIIPVETQETAEDSAALENIPVLEAPAENQTEDALLIEARTPTQDIVPLETETAAEEEPVFVESEPAIEDAAAVEAQTEVEEPETIFIDYTTTKLPPVESVLRKRPPENIVITEIEPIFSFKHGFLDIHKTSEPVRIEWEQPDDVPTTTQALSFSKKELADATFHAPKADFIDDDEGEVIDVGDADSPIDSLPEDDEPRQTRAAERPVFSYDDSGTTWHLPEWHLPEWNLPDKRKILTGTGILALLVVAIGGTLLSRKFLSARASRQTTAQSSTSEKTLPKSAEPAKAPENIQPAAAKTEALPVNNPAADEAAIPELPNYQPRGETDAKTALPAVMENRSKKRVLKEAVEKLEQTVQTKSATKEPPVFDKKGDVKPTTVKKPAVKNQVSTPAKTDIFTRPRIVKTQ